jgi:hypothetical protein
MGELCDHGIAEEALLAIVIQRLTALQQGRHKCGWNESALGYLREALRQLEQRSGHCVAHADQEATGRDG